LMIYYSDYILTDHFRKMFAYADILLCEAMSIGEFYLFEKNGDSILLGAPMFEVSNLHESANWIGIITTPSATLTIDQLNIFGKHLENLDSSNLPTIVKETLDHFSTIMYTVDVASTYFIKYSVPFKNIENDCYSLAWPFACGQDF